MTKIAKDAVPLSKLLPDLKKTSTSSERSSSPAIASHSTSKAEEKKKGGTSTKPAQSGGSSITTTSPTSITLPSQKQKIGKLSAALGLTGKNPLTLAEGQELLKTKGRMLPHGLRQALNATEASNSQTAYVNRQSILFNPTPHDIIYSHQMVVKLTAEDLPMLNEHMDELIALLGECNGNMESTEIIYRLMELYHHQTEKGDLDRSKRIGAAYLEDLGEYPTWAIHAACKDWRRENRWRPMISELRQACQAYVNPIARRLRVLEEAINSIDKKKVDKVA